MGAVVAGKSDLERAGDTRPARLARLRVALPSLAVVFALTFVLAEWVDIVGTVLRDGRSGGYLVDHVAIWAAAKLALAGTPELAYDLDALRAAQALPPDTPPDALLLWLYPPHAFLVAAPLGAIGFGGSFLTFSVLSLAVWAWAIHGPASTFAEARLWLLAAPPLVYCLVTGQPSLLWTAGFVMAIEALRARREVTAGLIFALLTMKPQLGLLVPVALIAGGYWRTIGWGALGFVLLVAVVTAIAGTDIWRGFLGAISFQRLLIEHGGARIHHLLGLYPFLRAIGTSHEIAALAQPLAPIAMAGLVATTWRRSRALSFDARAAVLCLAGYLAAPYAQFYDGLILAVAALYWARALAERSRFGRAARCLILAGGIASCLVFVPGFPLALLLTPLAAAALIWSLAAMPALRGPAPGHGQVPTPKAE